MIKRLATIALLVLLAQPLAAQITVPFTLQPQTVIASAPLNTNFSTIANSALNRLTGGTMVGTLITTGILPSLTNTYDVGSSAALYRTGYFQTSFTLGTALGSAFVINGAPLTFNECCVTRFIAGAVGANTLQISNTLAGTGNYGALIVGADAINNLLINAYSSTLTPSAYAFPNGVSIESLGTGGLSVMSDLGATRFYTTSGTLRGTMSAAGGFSWGDAVDPGATNFRVAGTALVNGLSTFTGGVTIANGLYMGAGGNLTDSQLVPTLSGTNFGSSATIAGYVYAMRIIPNGTGIAMSGTVNFNGTFPVVPVCVASDSIAGTLLGVSASTTQVSISSTATLAGTITVHCRGI